MNINSKKTYTSQIIGNSKFYLAICMVAAAAVDALIAVLLFLGGYNPILLIFPGVLFLLDLAYFIVGLTATNYRFRYSIGVWLTHILLTILVCTLGTLQIFQINGTVLTYIALGLWVGVHLISVVCVLFTALYTSKVIKSGVFTAMLTLLLTAVTAFYAIFLLNMGFFGQGNGHRTLIYEYDEVGDCYTVSGVLEGKSQTVYIDNSFNGKPVKNVSCSIFANDTVSEYIFYDNFKLIDIDQLGSGDMQGKKVYVYQDYASALRAQLFSCASNTNIRANALALANSAVPYCVEDNQSYIAFDYDEQAYAACNGNVLPLMLFDRGATVTMSDYGDTYGYLAHNDKNDVEDLAWGYENCNGTIFDDVLVEGQSVLNGYALKESVNAQVKFENVYRVYVGRGNDAKYDLQDKQAEFCSDTLNSTALGYRYLAESNAQTFLDGVTARQGFELGWDFAEHGKTTKSPLGTLRAALNAISGLEIDIYPVWELNKPTVEIISTDADNSIVYGDDISFGAQATAPADGISLIYEWTHNGSQVGNSSTLSLSKPSLSGGYDGEYLLTVTTDGGSVTSLTSSKQAKVSLNISKKVVSFDWELPAESNRVYSGTAKRVEPSVLTQLVGDDILAYNLSVNSNPTSEVYADCINAGVYNFALELTGNSALDYEIDAASATNSLIIKRREAEVVWSNYDFTYSGLTQTPTANAYGVFSEEIVSSVNGGKVHAGTYQATAVCTDKNYVLTNDAFIYTIAKAPLTVTANDCQAVYGYSSIQNSGVQYSGFVNSETQSVLGGSLNYSFTNDQVTVGTYVGCVKASGLTSSDYEISYVDGNLEITCRPVQVTWLNYNNLVYNGEAKNVIAMVSNRVRNDDVGLTVSNGNQVNADTYEACVYTDALTGTSAANYVIEQTFTKSYTIAKAKITISPASVTVVYGEPEGELTATISGTVYNSDFYYTLSRETGDTVGTYVVSVNIVGDDANYDITTRTAQYKINKRTVTITWNGYENLVYNGLPHTVNADLGNIVNSDDVYAEVSGGTATNAGNYTARAALGGTAANNYALPSVYTQQYFIEKATLGALSVTLESYVYGTPSTAVVSGNDGGGQVTYTYGTTNDYSSSSSASRLGVGDYYVFASVAETANYKSGIANAQFTVSVRELTLSWSKYTALVYDATAKNVTATLDNVVSGDDVSVVVTNGNRVNAGSYVAVASLAGADAANYKLPDEKSIDYTIDKAQITLIAQDAWSYYGQAVAEISVQLIGAIYNGEVTYSAYCAVTPSSAVNSYEITVQYNDDTGNYKITTFSGTYSVLKATPTLEGITQNVYVVTDEVAYGTTLAQISGMLPEQTISGSWAWQDGGDTTVGEEGTRQFVVVFNPDDSTNYNPVTVTVTVTVKAA